MDKEMLQLLLRGLFLVWRKMQYVEFGGVYWSRSSGDQVVEHKVQETLQICTVFQHASIVCLNCV